MVHLKDIISSILFVDTFDLGNANVSGGLSYASPFYVADALGNLLGITDGSNQGFPDGLNWDGFGNLVGRVGSTSAPLGYGEASGYVTDGDSGLRLLGHRYYDSRTGRFISQDPAGVGDNWYAYAGNDPVKNTDPSGLSTGVPGTLGAPDERYGGLFGDDPAGVFGGESNLDEFFASEDAAMERGMAGYLAAVAAQAKASHRQYYHQWLDAPGTVWNNSSYSIPIMFDHDTKTGKVFYEMTLPPHTYTGLEDIDFVYSANDPNMPGGYDWKHILGDTNVRVSDAGTGKINISGLFFGPTFKGYPYNVRPIPVSGNTYIAIFTIPRPIIPPLLTGPIP